ncbi:MAG: hypothetical protein ABFR63_03205 [Thermodesulfobacteriota bacterium]
MKRLILVCALIAFFQQTALAGRDCGVYGSDRWNMDRRYRDCSSCLKENKHCEERCYKTGYRCSAVGYYRGYRKEVQGRVRQNRIKAEQSALKECRRSQLNDCRLAGCDREGELDRNSVRGCRRNTNPPPPPRPQPPQAGRKRVVSWQHVKGQCYQKPFPKISQHCGNRGLWHGISCMVNWSDGSRTEVTGQVDLVDVYGNRYCTRATRPARFNCVDSCDYTSGPVSYP